MASGIDMSARMVSLAINIAMMGFILTSGVAAHLKLAVPSLSLGQLYLVAQLIAAGNVVSVPGLPQAIVHEALANGFGWVMIYGGIGVWSLAVISFVIFNTRSAPQAKVQCSK
jgi:hypothetical protein